MTTSTTVTDPVCGMTIDPAQAAGTSEYGGETYYFCSRACQRAFEADPQRFLGAAEPPVRSSCSVDGGCCG